MTVTALAVMASPAMASDTSGTANLGAGTLTMAAPATVAFNATLDGTNQTVSANQDIDVMDNTGSAAGWNITLTTTQFTTAGSDVLPADAASDVAASGVCDVIASCTLGDNSATTYPAAIPAGVVAPTAVKIQSAAIQTGLSGQTWSHTMHLAIPATARAGTYSSTWTCSLTSAP